MAVGSLEVVRYRVELIQGQPKIIIEQIRVNDENGNYLKFAKLKDVLPYLSKFPVKFKELKDV